MFPLDPCLSDGLQRPCLPGSKGEALALLSEVHPVTLRRHDPDRYFCTLFAEAAKRDTLAVLYAFNHELARAPEAAREPGLALIRLQWWREVVEGADRAHEVAIPLRAALAGGQLQAGELRSMIEAREQEAEGGFDTLAAWHAWLQTGPGTLAVAAGRTLGAPPEALDRLRRLGAGIGAAGALRNVAAHAGQGRCLLPRDVLAAHGLSAEAVLADPASDRLRAVRATLAAEAARLLGEAEPCGRAWVAAGLPAVFARRDLRRQKPVRLVTDQVAVTLAAIRSIC